MKSFAKSLITPGIAIFIPFFLLMTAIRLLLSPLFLQIEYHLPGFPPDPYGFTLEDRLHWSRISVDYLLNNEGIEFLSQQRLSDGSPLFNERELTHMLDVKILVQQMIKAWTLLLIVLISLALWAWRGNWLRTYLRGLGLGGRLTIGLIIFILLAVAISFRALFTGFHLLFFQGDTWLFRFDDNLIRLFPMRFWQDGFILVGILTLVGAGLLIFLEKRFVKN